MASATRGLSGMPSSSGATAIGASSVAAPGAGRASPGDGKAFGALLDASVAASSPDAPSVVGRPADPGTKDAGDHQETVATDAEGDAASSLDALDAMLGALPAGIAAAGDSSAAGAAALSALGKDAASAPGAKDGHDAGVKKHAHTASGDSASVTAPVVTAAALPTSPAMAVPGNPATASASAMSGADNAAEAAAPATSNRVSNRVLPQTSLPNALTPPAHMADVQAQPDTAAAITATTSLAGKAAPLASGAPADQASDDAPVSGASPKRGPQSVAGAGTETTSAALQQLVTKASEKAVSDQRTGTSASVLAAPTHTAVDAGAPSAQPAAPVQPSVSLAPVAAPSLAGNSMPLSPGTPSATPVVAAAAAAAAPQPVGFEGATQPLGDALNTQILSMVANGHSQVTLHLAPPALGTLSLRVDVQANNVSTWFGSTQPQVQQAVTDALGQLQTNLSGAGFNLVGAWVGADASGGRGQGSALPLPPRRASFADAAIDRVTGSGEQAPPSSRVSVYV